MSRIRNRGARCERIGCRRENVKVQHNGGLCAEHLLELKQVGPDEFAWKPQSGKLAARNALGQQEPAPLDDEMIASVTEIITATGLMIDGAVYAGVRRETFSRWLAAGRRPDADPILVRLVEAVDDALSRFAVARVSRIAVDTDWRASAWLLEHHPNTRRDFGAVVRREVANADGIPFQTEQKHTLDLSKLSLEQKRAMVEMLKQAGSEDIIDGEVVELPQIAAGDP